MDTIGLLAIITAIILGAILYTVWRNQRASEVFTGEMKALIEEAKMVRKDLNTIISNAEQLSDTMIQNLDERITRIEKCPEDLQMFESSGFPNKDSIIAEEAALKIEALRSVHPSIAVPRLYNEGYTIPEIAELLSKGQGEVRLILDLQNKKEAGV
ncbi:MAG: hypothetical protein GXY50_07110 [Syntrophomonadaceae bacterium]|nr:hypothetical protein [Syntrophomonadaceae bacterium]